MPRRKSKLKKKPKLSAIKLDAFLREPRHSLVAESRSTFLKSLHTSDYSERAKLEAFYSKISTSTIKPALKEVRTLRNAYRTTPDQLKVLRLIEFGLTTHEIVMLSHIIKRFYYEQASKASPAKAIKLLEECYATHIQSIKLIMVQLATPPTDLLKHFTALSLDEMAKDLNEISSNIIASLTYALQLLSELTKVSLCAGKLKETIAYRATEAELKSYFKRGTLTMPSETERSTLRTFFLSQDVSRLYTPGAALINRDNIEAYLTAIKKLIKPTLRFNKIAADILTIAVRNILCERSMPVDLSIERVSAACDSILSENTKALKRLAEKDDITYFKTKSKKLPKGDTPYSLGQVVLTVMPFYLQLAIRRMWSIGGLYYNAEKYQASYQLFKDSLMIDDIFKFASPPEFDIKFTILYSSGVLRRVTFNLEQTRLLVRLRLASSIFPAVLSTSSLSLHELLHGIKLHESHLVDSSKKLEAETTRLKSTLRSLPSLKAISTMHQISEMQVELFNIPNFYLTACQYTIKELAETLDEAEESGLLYPSTQKVIDEALEYIKSLLFPKIVDFFGPYFLEISSFIDYVKRLEAKLAEIKSSKAEALEAPTTITGKATAAAAAPASPATRKKESKKRKSRPLTLFREPTVKAVDFSWPNPFDRSAPPFSTSSKPHSVTRVKGLHFANPIYATMWPANLLDKIDNEKERVILKSLMTECEAVTSNRPGIKLIGQRYDHITKTTYTARLQHPRTDTRVYGQMLITSTKLPSGEAKKAGLIIFSLILNHTSQGRLLANKRKGASARVHAHTSSP